MRAVWGDGMIKRNEWEESGKGWVKCGMDKSL